MQLTIDKREIRINMHQGDTCLFPQLVAAQNLDLEDQLAAPLLFIVTPTYKQTSQNKKNSTPNRSY